MRKLEIIFLALILVLAFSVRLYKIERPIADWHSWRQADTAAVARNFIKNGYNPLVPKYDDLSTQANGLDNPNGYRFVEFPIFNSIIAAVWTFSGVSTLYARLVTVIISVASTLLLYLLVRKFSGSQVGFIAAILFATIPYNVFYSSTILPAPLMVFALLATYLTFAKWMENDKNIYWMAASVFFTNVAILTWPIALIFMLPVVLLAVNKYGLSFISKFNLWLFAILSIAPFLAWRIWMLRFPEGIPSWQFLLNEGGIRFKGAFFRWLVAERIGTLILTVSGFALFVIGIVKKPTSKEGLFYFSILASAILYFVIFASGNVRHDYYQIPFIMPAAIFMALGVKSLISQQNLINRVFGTSIAIVLILFMYAFGYYEVRGFYWVNHPEIVEAGQAVDRILPKNATVIAPYGGDAAFLYQTNRRGYPVIDRPLEKFIDSGTQYLVSTDPNEPTIKTISQNCEVLSRNKNYVIIRLSHQCI